ncbi:MAG: lysylphosphatidylglycerol synthase transmembrane domain-containing protein [bacterium]
MKKIKPFIFAVLVAIATYTVFLKFSELKKIATLLTQGNYFFLLAALACQTIAYLFIGKSYKTIVEGFTDIVIRLGIFCKTAIVMMFLNQALPSMGISSNAYFFSNLKKKGVQAGKGIFLVIFNLIVLYTSYLFSIMTVVAYLLARGNLSSLQLTATIIMAAGTLALIIVLGFLTRKISRIRKMLKLLSIFLPIGLIDADKIAQELFTSKSQIAQEKKVYFKAVFLRMSSFAFECGTIYMIFLAFKITPSFIAIATAYLMAHLFALITFMPGGLGVFETTMILTLRGFGATLEAALMITLIYRGFAFWLPMPLGLWLYRHQGKENS